MTREQPDSSASGATSNVGESQAHEEPAASFVQVLATELDEIDKKRSLAEAVERSAAQPDETSARKRGLEDGKPELLFPDRTRREKLRQEQPEPPKPAPPVDPENTTPIGRANEKGLLGLAFSGGGIRSATFNLGALQGLAERKLLHRFDYLSTVSGGGYIGAWLAGWIYRRGMKEVETRLAADRRDQPNYREPAEIRFLREYSNYLTPRKGLLGADTWTAIAIYLRNLILNQTVLFLFLSGVLLIPWVLTALVGGFHNPPAAISSVHPGSLTVLIILTGVGVIPTWMVNRSMWNYTANPPDRVLARVLETSSSGRQLFVKFLVSPASAGDRLLRSKPRVQIWDASVKQNRSPAETFTVRRSRRECPSSRGWLFLSAPVKAKAKDLVIAAYPSSSRRRWIYITVALPIFLEAVMLAVLLSGCPSLKVPALLFQFVFAAMSFAISPTGGLSLNWVTLLTLRPQPWVLWAFLGALVLYFFWTMTFLLPRPSIDRPESGRLRKLVSAVSVGTSPMFAGAIGGLLLWRLIPVLSRWAVQPAGMWRVLGFGAPLVMLSLLAVTVFQIGLLGVRFSDPRREWWGRLAAMLLRICFAWAALFALAGYGPLLMDRLLSYPKSAWLAALGWLVTIGLGVLGGKNAKPGDVESKVWKTALLNVTPYVFILGLLILMSWGWQAMLLRSVPSRPPENTEHGYSLQAAANGRAFAQSFAVSIQFNLGEHTAASSGLSSAYWKQLERILCEADIFPGRQAAFSLLLLFLLCLGLSYLLAMRIDLNEFSMHYLYRNRLVRCYLGASHRERVPNPFTGFDMHDEIHLKDLRIENFRYDGPIPIFCSALNLVKGEDLAWQDRKAESFAMTPFHCGYDVWFEQLPRPGQQGKAGLERYGYRPTSTFAYPKGLYVGTAMAISGAAASPNMGCYTSPALSFLMTMFNVRLGWWVGNTRHPKSWRDAGPQVGLGYLLAELLGNTDDLSKYVYLSDGGHFENLGLYELIKRRCRFILASDADADKDFTFGNLASAVEKCRADMGIDIKIRTQKIIPTGTPPYSQWHCAVGKILYSKSDEKAKDGLLVYIKPSLTSDEPTDVLNYKSSHQDFPHQSTADQWFTESQFESYRMLGLHVVQTLFRDIPSNLFPSDPGRLSIEELFQALASLWDDPEHIQIT